MNREWMKEGDDEREHGRKQKMYEIKKEENTCNVMVMLWHGAQNRVSYGRIRHTRRDGNVRWGKTPQKMRFAEYFSSYCYNNSPRISYMVTVFGHFNLHRSVFVSKLFIVINPNYRQRNQAFTLRAGVAGFRHTRCLKYSLKIKL